MPTDSQRHDSAEERAASDNAQRIHRPCCRRMCDMQIANGMTVLNALADESAQRTKAHADSLQEVAQGIRKAILSI